jgi:hypothetical protein
MRLPRPVLDLIGYPRPVRPVPLRLPQAVDGPPKMQGKTATYMPRLRHVEDAAVGLMDATRDASYNDYPSFAGRFHSGPPGFDAIRNRTEPAPSITDRTRRDDRIPRAQAASSSTQASHRPLAGGRLTNDSYHLPVSSSSMAILPPPDHEKAWRIENLDSRTLSKEGPNKIIEMLSNISPEVSRALWDFLRLCNPGFEWDAYTPGTETNNDKATKALDDFFFQLRLRHGTVDVLIGRLFTGAWMRGAFMAELVLDEAGKVPLDIATPDPSSARFKVSDDPVNKGPWILGQWQAGKFVELDRETIEYIPIDPFPDSPYGRPMVGPALFSTLFLIGLMHDLRRVIAQQGYPRIDVMIQLDKVLSRMPADLRDNPTEQEKWVTEAIGAVQTAYNALQPDAAYIHDDSIEVKGPVGAATQNALGGIDAIISMLERMAVRALKTMPLILGITDGVSEANANRQWEIMAAGIKSIQHYCESLLERFLSLALQAQGITADVKFRFAENRSAEEMRDQQTLQLKIANYTSLRNQNIIDQDETADKLVGHPPVGDPPVFGATTSTTDTTTSSSSGDPEPGSKRADDGNHLTRASMEQAGYGRVVEWCREGKQPMVDADERIVSVRETGAIRTVNGTAWHEWDIYFRMDDGKARTNGHADRETVGASR